MDGSGESLGEGELRRTMRDLVALSTLPALWAGYDTRSIAGSLGDVLLKILDTDFVFVTVRQVDREPVSVCRGAGGRDTHAPALLEEMTPWIEGHRSGPPELRHPDDGAPLYAALSRFGHSGDDGVVVAASRREGFPGEVDRLLLGVGANQTATVLQRKRSEEALRDEAARKDDFLAILGHELRNPLGPIRNSLEILERAEGDPEQHRRARQIMHRQLVHLTRLVDDLLDVSRISRGKIQLRRERLDVVQLVRETVEDHRAAIAEAGLRLELELPSQPSWLEGDRVRLAQALGNLLENSCKFSDRGGRVQVSLHTEGGEAELRVADDGVGIAAEELPDVFEPFGQSLSAQDRSRTGLGLGLAVVKSLVELHGGTVEVSSAGSERGAEFTLRLPLVEDQRAAPAEAPSATAPAAAMDHSILLIEDNLDAAEALGELLRLNGHRVEVAHDGEQGVSKARDLRPDVVLCDIGLPGAMDGYDVARSVRRDPSVSDAFLVALTGFGQDSDRKLAREAGFDAHLTKPADPSALERLLAERRAPAEATER